MPWLVALGLHGVLVFTPWSKLVNSPPKPANAGRVRVVESAATPEKAASVQPVPIAQSAPSDLVVAKRRPPPPAKPVAKPKPPAKPPVRNQPAPQAARSPVPAKPAKKPPVKQTSPAVKPNDLVVNLAQLPDTQPCGKVEGCWRSQKSQWRSVYAKVQEQITAQGYRVTELELEDDTGFRVSQIAKNGETKYFLHLLSTLEGTIYILNPSQLSKEEVEQRVSQAQSLG